MEEIVKRINDTNASYRTVGSGDAKNTDLFLDNDHYPFFGSQNGEIRVRLNKKNLAQAILFIASILPLKYDSSSKHMRVDYSRGFVYDNLALLDAVFTTEGKPCESKIFTWNVRKDIVKKNGKIDNRLYLNGLISDASFKNSEGQIVKTKFIIRNYLAGGYSDIHFRSNDDGVYDCYITNARTPLDDGKDKGREFSEASQTPSLQMIFYGAPGTGKSHTVNNMIKKASTDIVISDQDSFNSYLLANIASKTTRNYIGYLSSDLIIKSASQILNKNVSSIYEVTDTSDIKKIYDNLKDTPQDKTSHNGYSSAILKYKEFIESIKGTKTSTRNLPNHVRTTFHPDSDYASFVGAYKPTMRPATLGRDEKITYEFVAQSFLKAYEEAWKLLAKNAGNPEAFYLVIEEINRGNCAQIFGDLFQLLDRNDEGYSEYAITPDKDIKNYLAGTFKDVEGLPEDVKSGEVMKLPKNLYILATMNTSDQSLFPIDSAFKRRWDWEYVPITNAELGWKIEADKKKYDWWTFLEKINEKVGELTSSEDKKLGYFFAKAKGGVIDAKTFVSKVAFYLWNDVFKDYGTDSDIFKTDDKGDITFTKFFTQGGDALVAKFIENVGVTADGKDAEEAPSENDETTEAEE